MVAYLGRRWPFTGRNKLRPYIRYALRNGRNKLRPFIGRDRLRRGVIYHARSTPVRSRYNHLQPFLFRNTHD
jgi:hypothetical protein